MEKLTWFKFVISDWMMGKIMKCPEVTQARFLRLCCLYWNKECILTLEDAEIEIDEDHMLILFSKKIISKEDQFIKIKFLDEQNSEVISLSETRRLAVQERWRKLKEKNSGEIQDNTFVSKKDTNVSVLNTNEIQNDTDKSRVDKSRVDKNTISIVDRKLKFSQSLKPFLELYGKDTLNDFYLYWTEPNKSNTKFKQELEKTWELSSRLKRWTKSEFNKPKINAVKGATDQSQNVNLFK